MSYDIQKGDNLEREIKNSSNFKSQNPIKKRRDYNDLDEITQLDLNTKIH